MQEALKGAIATTTTTGTGTSVRTDVRTSVGASGGIETKAQVEFFVSGLPASQGSKTAYGRVVKDRATGKLRAIVNMVEQDKGLDEWRLAVAQMGRLMKPAGWQTDGMFMLSVVFHMPRPKAHFLKSGELRQDAPIFHTSRKDCDKLLRAIGDALTGVHYDDDCLIVSVAGAKVYEDPQQGPGAWISVSRLDEAMAGAIGKAFIG